ncbi:hypothetical protein MKW92_028116 [Papaver armeniacum]|nr:hypothetical protein MKW92_028116 [Papaver armeniacum]
MNAVVAVKPLHYKIVGLYSGLSQFELEDHKNMEILESSSIARENQNDIWELFRETQRNILYLNQRQLMALEEMKKTPQEKQSLLDRVHQLEVELASIQNGSPIVASDTATMWPQFLLRIDPMVLKRMITTDTEESSNLRGIVVNNKSKVADTFSDIQLKRDAELLEELRHFSDKCKQSGILILTGFHIIHICTELAPVASVGSLASYVTGISSELQENGNLVEVILPKYASLNLDGVQGLRNTKAESYSYFDGITFIEPVNHASYFNCDMIYGYSNDFERFSYFSRASLDYILISGKKPAILHIHNWETAIVGSVFWDGFVNQGLGARLLFTCHDLKNQRLEHPDKLSLCGLDPFRLIPRATQQRIIWELPVCFLSKQVCCWHLELILFELLM